MNYPKIDLFLLFKTSDEAEKLGSMLLKNTRHEVIIQKVPDPANPLRPPKFGIPLFQVDLETVSKLFVDQVTISTDPQKKVLRCGNP